MECWERGRNDLLNSERNWTVMRNICRKMGLGISVTLIEVICTSWCSRFSCIRIWKSMGVQKNCYNVPPTSWLCTGAWFVWHCPFHMHISLFLLSKENSGTGAQSWCMWSIVQLVNLMWKSSYLIPGIDTKDVYWCHCCTKLPYN